jgi:hypothetical protein
VTGRFAEGTTVSPEKSQAEIQQLLKRYGATGFAFGWESSRAMVGFQVHDRAVRFMLELPTDPAAFARTRGGQHRTPASRQAALEAEVRRRWRALALAIKAKLEVVASGIATFDEEFLAHLVLPDGTTVGERVVQELDVAYARGIAPPRLLALPPGETS